MICYSPSIDDPDQLMDTDTDTPTYLEYGFKLDDVVAWQNISKKENHRPFELYPNPVYFKFEDYVKYGRNEYLTIYGRHLDLACRQSDIVVMVGNGMCDITSLSRQKLICRPPVEVSDGNQVPTVSVIVGNVLTYKLGVLSYPSPDLTTSGLHRSIFFAVIAGVIAFILIIVLINFVFCYVRNQRNGQNNPKQQTSDPCVLNPSYENRASGTFPSLPNGKNTKTGRGDYYECPISYEEPIYAEIPEHLVEEQYDKLNFVPCKSKDVYSIPAQKNENKNCYMELST